MKLVNDVEQPQMVAIVEDPAEIDVLQKQVATVNQWLVDSGFDQYQYEVIQAGNRAFIERV